MGPRLRGGRGSLINDALLRTEGRRSALSGTDRDAATQRCRLRPAGSNAGQVVDLCRAEHAVVVCDEDAKVGRQQPSGRDVDRVKRPKAPGSNEPAMSTTESSIATRLMAFETLVAQAGL